MVTGFSSLGLKGKSDVLARQGCHLEALGKKLLPRSFRLLAKVISFQLLVGIRSLFFFAGSWPGATCWLLYVVSGTLHIFYMPLYLHIGHSMSSLAQLI